MNNNNSLSSSSSGTGCNANGNGDSNNMPDATASCSTGSDGGDPAAAAASGSRKRKARDYATAEMDPAALLAHQRDISRRSSQRHRQKERLLTVDYINRQTQLEDTNQKLKEENEVLRSKIQAVKAHKNTKGTDLRTLHNVLVSLAVNNTEDNVPNHDKKPHATLPPPPPSPSAAAASGGSGSGGPPVVAMLVPVAPVLPYWAHLVAVPAAAIAALAHAPPALNQPLPCMTGPRQVCHPQVPIRSGIISGGGRAFHPPVQNSSSRPAIAAGASSSLAPTVYEPAAILNNLTLEDLLTVCPSLVSGCGFGAGAVTASASATATATAAAAAAAATQPIIQQPRPAAAVSPRTALDNVISGNVAGIRELDQVRRALLLEQDVMLAAFIAKDSNPSRAKGRNMVIGRTQLAAAPVDTNDSNSIPSLVAAIVASRKSNGVAVRQPPQRQQLQLLLEQLQFQQQRSRATLIMPPPAMSAAQPAAAAAAAAVPVTVAASTRSRLQQLEQWRQLLAPKQAQRSPPPHPRPPVVAVQFSASTTSSTPNDAAIVLLLKEITRRGEQQQQQQQGPSSSSLFPN